MVNSNTSTIKKRSQSKNKFLCRDFNTAIVRACVIKNKKDIEKANEILKKIDCLFHSEYDEDLQIDFNEFNLAKEYKIEMLFDELNKIEHKFIPASSSYNFRSEQHKYHNTYLHDAYWGF